MPHPRATASIIFSVKALVYNDITNIEMRRRRRVRHTTLIPDSALISTRRTTSRLKFDAPRRITNAITHDKKRPERVIQISVTVYVRERSAFWTDAVGIRCPGLHRMALTATEKSIVDEHPLFATEREDIIRLLLYSCQA